MTTTIAASSSHEGTAALLEAHNLCKTFPRGREEVRALDDVTFSIGSGEFVAVVGPSGSGKTTLLNLLGCMNTPTSGSLRLAGCEVESLSDAELTRLRSEQVGFVFQHFGLVPTLTVGENIALPTLFDRRARRLSRAERKVALQRVDELLEVVAMAARRDHRPHELSGGEMQRAAIARALINRPSLLLADEPTGNLDSATGETIIDLFRRLNLDGLTVVVVTHNADLADAAPRHLTLRDGKLCG